VVKKLTTKVRQGYHKGSQSHENHFSYANGNTSEAVCACFMSSSIFLTISGFDADKSVVSPSSDDRSYSSV